MESGFGEEPSGAESLKKSKRLSTRRREIAGAAPTPSSDLGKGMTTWLNSFRLWIRRFTRHEEDYEAIHGSEAGKRGEINALIYQKSRFKSSQSTGIAIATLFGSAGPDNGASNTDFRKITFLSAQLEYLNIYFDLSRRKREGAGAERRMLRFSFRLRLHFLYLR